MRTIDRDEALRRVRNRLNAALYERQPDGGWNVFTHGFGGTLELELEGIKDQELPSKILAEYKASGCRSMYTDGFFDVHAVGDSTLVIDTTVVIRDNRSDVAAAGTFVGGLLRGLFR